MWEATFSKINANKFLTLLYMDIFRILKMDAIKVKPVKAVAIRIGHICV